MTTEQMDEADSPRRVRATVKSLVTIEASETGNPKFLSLSEVHEFLTKLHADGVDLETIDYKVQIRGMARLRSIAVITRD